MTFSWGNRSVLITGGVGSIAGFTVQQVSDMYWKENLSLPKISKIVSRNDSTILYFMRKYGIPTRSRMESNTRRKPKIQRSCLWCSKSISLLESAIQKGHGKYCSLRCKGLSQKGKIPWNKGKHWGEDVKRKMRENHWDISGSNHPLYGKGHTAESKLKMSKSGREIWKDPKKRKAMLSSLERRPTSPEVRFLEIVGKNMIPLRYTGDGSFWVAHLNPDFIPIGRRKIAVEIFGEYWHSPLRNEKIRASATLSSREKEFRKHGWKMIVFWDSEVFSENGEKIILGRLKTHGLF